MKEIMTVTFTVDEDPHIFGNWTNSSAGSKFNNLSTLLNEDDYQKNNVQSSITAQEYDLISVLCLTILLSFIILATIAGNVFVLIAILRERNLQTLSNYLVFSLAIADLMVACLVMPIGAQYEVMEEWILGSVMCEIWTSGDVLCCTASILHLVAIAVDRYCAVTNINYVQYRSTRRVGLMIATVWCVSFIVSFAPILGWKDQEFLLRVQKDKKCLVSQDIGYQIFATCATFYVPLIIILILYWRIYQVVRKRIRHRPGHAIRPAALLPLVCAENVPSMTALNGSSKMISGTKLRQKSRDNLESKRERKAAKTLAIITGVFVMCWLPFFIMALLMAICPDLIPDARLFSLFLWLGYANSTLNPLIYTVFSPDFKKAFSKLFCGKTYPQRTAPSSRQGCMSTVDTVF
ncbi:5-hydroxytryptamine receptor [Trichonephila inaurata madagascariensis]|uniref:5-hydroxytryptamine receptor n=1 Tax=Trichonephila inaurata madagascariensis TaxID=2747483 RepID=A0A8X7BXB2_9ARAC|nr:5-hydroxytryptamine receptor [Trichonephila inaurata madagascariensis]